MQTGKAECTVIRTNEMTKKEVKKSLSSLINLFKHKTILELIETSSQFIYSNLVVECLFLSSRSQFNANHDLLSPFLLYHLAQHGFFYLYLYLCCFFFGNMYSQNEADDTHWRIYIFAHFNGGERVKKKTTTKLVVSTFFCPKSKKFLIAVGRCVRND